MFNGWHRKSKLLSDFVSVSSKLSNAPFPFLSFCPDLGIHAIALVPNPRGCKLLEGWSPALLASAAELHRHCYAAVPSIICSIVGGKPWKGDLKKVGWDSKLFLAVVGTILKASSSSYEYGAIP